MSWAREAEPEFARQGMTVSASRDSRCKPQRLKRLNAWERLEKGRARTQEGMK